MAINDFLKKDVNRLVTPQKPKTPLQRVLDNARIAAKRGTGSYTPLPADSITPNVRREDITIYSHLIITADGAFEMPPNWPADGTYPAWAWVPDPLPDSLINDGGGLRLDTDVQYYQQKRVHAVVYESFTMSTDANGDEVASAPSFVEERYYIPMAVPFEGDYYCGRETNTVAPLQLVFTVNQLVKDDPRIQAKVQVLRDNGLGEE